MCYARVRPDDIGRQFTRQKQQTHDVYSKVALEHLRIDFEKRPPPASDRVMDQRTRDTIQVPDFRDRFGNLDVIGDGADHRMGVRKLSF